MRRIFDLAFAFAALTAIVWMAIAVQLAARDNCAGPAVAMVKPFGSSLAAIAHRSGS